MVTSAYAQRLLHSVYSIASAVLKTMGPVVPFAHCHQSAIRQAVKWCRTSL